MQVEIQESVIKLEYEMYGKYEEIKLTGFEVWYGFENNAEICVRVCFVECFDHDESKLRSVVCGIQPLLLDITNQLFQDLKLEINDVLKPLPLIFLFVWYILIM